MPNNSAFPAVNILMEQADRLDVQADAADETKSEPYRQAAKIIRLAAQIALAGASEILATMKS